MLHYQKVKLSACILSKLYISEDYHLPQARSWCASCDNMVIHHWLVVSTPLKNISQLG